MEELLHHPVGDLLEKILTEGGARFPEYAGFYHLAPRSFRLSVLIGGLCLGAEAEEEIRDRLTRRESPEKRRLFLGLGAMGHPLAEGYLARVVREFSLEGPITEALAGLGRIRGAKSLPLVLRALDYDFLFPAACEALAAYGGPEATAALIGRVDEFPAFRALAALGATEARDAFREGLGRGSPWDVEAARGIGRLGDPALGAELVPHLEAADADLARVAFEALARLGAPGGAGPLLAVAGRRLEGWMVEALGRVDDPEVHRFLFRALDRPAGRWSLKRLLGRRPAGPDEGTVYRALREARDPEVVAGLARRLRGERDPARLRALLAVRALGSDPGYADVVMSVWRRREDLLGPYLAARVLLQTPTEEFLAEALDRLGRPGFVPLDEAPEAADRERLLETYATENNACLLVGGFLDAGLVDPDALEAGLRERFTAGAKPTGKKAPGAAAGGSGPEGTATFLNALAAARPTMADGLRRLFALLEREEDRGDPLLDLFLCWTGAHRGGLQRAVIQAFPNALGRLIRDRTDRYLPELEALAAHAPREGAVGQNLADQFERARRALQRECRDMSLLLEGSQRGDMVLIETL